MIDENYGVVGSSSGSQYLVRVLSALLTEKISSQMPELLFTDHLIQSWTYLPPDTDAAV
jgi:hypothetical protein